MTNIFMTVLNMSVTAAFVIAILCLARLVLRKIHAPKWISYALWAVAGFRLAVPFTFESVLSLIPRNLPSVAAPVRQYYEALPPIGTPERIDYMFAASHPAGVPIWTAYDALAAVWLAGIAVMLLYAVISYVRLMRRKDSVATPFVYGFIKPKIHIPSGLAGEELRYVTLHEQTHIKRRDHLVKLLAFALLCVHWFNPLAWVAFVLLCTDMEMSCDERVLRELGMGVKADYSQTLLSLSLNHRILGASPLAFGEGGLKERVKNVLNFQKRSRVIIIVAVALVAVLTVGFAVSKRPSGATDRDLRNFSVYGFMLGEPVSNDLIETLVPTDRYASEGYDYNYENVRYSLDAETGAIRKLWYDVYENGYMTNDVSASRWQRVEQVTQYYGDGRQGWQDREQGLRYVEYSQKEGRLAATVRFVYADNTSDGIDHRLIWVIAESSLPYPPKPFDLAVLATLRTPYVSDNSAVGKIVELLPPLGEKHTQKFFSIGDDYGSGLAPYTLTVYYEQAGTINDAYALTPRNAVLLLALIDNLEEVSYAVRTSPSGDTLDTSAYLDRITYNRADLGEYLATVGLTWADFHEDWSASVEKAFALIGDGRIPSNWLGNLDGDEMNLNDLRGIIARDGGMNFTALRPFKHMNVSSDMNRYMLEFALAEGYRLSVYADADSKQITSASLSDKNANRNFSLDLLKEPEMLENFLSGAYTPEIAQPLINAAHFYRVYWSDFNSGSEFARRNVDNPDLLAVSSRQYLPSKHFDSAKELAEYIAAGGRLFDKSFAAQLERYDDDYFSENNLTLLYVEEGSGSITHDIGSVAVNAAGTMAIGIQRFVPEIGTDDMLSRFIVIECAKAVTSEVKSFAAYYQPTVEEIAPVPLADLPNDYGAYKNREQAIADGVYVNVQGVEIYNQTVVDIFYENALAGVPAFMRVIHYTIEGDPVITDFQYDGEVFFTITSDSSRDIFGGYDDKNLSVQTYKHLIRLGDDWLLSQVEADKVAGLATGWIPAPSDKAAIS